MNITEMFQIILDPENGEVRVYSKQNYFTLSPNEQKLRLFLLKEMRERLQKHEQWLAK